MHGNNMLTVKRSALALLRRQQAVLRLVRDTPGLVLESPAGKELLLDKQRLTEMLEVLDGEISKVENLEAVIAVVGTMKAGKSTTINAIAGTEVLPNRNQPMTTMPTLIRHTPGRKEPILTFPKAGPILALEASVRGLLQELQASGGFDVLETWHQDDGRKLVQRILAGRGDWIAGRHVGVDEIFIVLRDLNDLVRLAREAPIGLSLADDDYDEIHELPVIEVEFTHLAKTTGGGLGRLTLMDTPGPNEAGQGDALFNIMKEQLEKASAVLAVLDYSQLLSTADEQVRGALSVLSSQLVDRTFALVNRFDLHSANSMGEAEVRTFVTKALLDIEEERVFPASARWGYLSSRLLTSLQSGEDVRDVKDASWFRDFADLANLDEEERNDPKELARQAKKFWRKSHFEPLLTQVIARAHQQAAQICVEAALAKMNVYGGLIEGFLALRKFQVTQENARLQQMVDILDQEGAKESLAKLHRHIEVVAEHLDDWRTAQRMAFPEPVVSRVIVKKPIKVDGKAGLKVSFRLNPASLPARTLIRTSLHQRDGTPLQSRGLHWHTFGNLEWDDSHCMTDPQRPHDRAVFFPFAAIEVERAGVMKCLARVTLWGPPGEIGRAEAEFELTAE
jgi:GTPase SAR1 family protein